MRASIIIPAHNEEKRIDRTLKAYSDYFESIRKSEKEDYKIIVVINGTTDKTEELVKRHCLRNSRISYLSFVRGGKGFAVMEGFKHAVKDQSCDVVGFVDADMATEPYQFHRLIKEAERYDCVIANRYLKSSKVFPPITFRRIVVGRAFNFIIRAMFLMPYTDTQCGAKVFRKNALKRIIPRISMSKWAFDVDLLYQAKAIGCSIKQLDTVWTDRAFSKINFFKAAPWMLLGIVRLRIINSPFRRFIRIYDSLIKIAT